MRLLFPLVPALLSAACGSPRPVAPALPEALPPLFVSSQDTYWGDFLGGDRPVVGDQAQAPAAGLVRARFVWWAGLPAGLTSAPALEPEAGLLVGINRAQPVLPEGSLLRRVRILEQMLASADTLELTQREAALLPGATTSFALSLPAAAIAVRLEVSQGEPSAAPRLALWIDGPAPQPRPSPFGDPVAPEAELPLEELVELPGSVGPRYLALAVPELEGWLGLAVGVSPSEPDNSERLSALLPLARAQAERAGARALSARQPFDRRAFERQRRQAALEALLRPAAARAAILTLADPGGARLAGDVALCAEPEQLNAFAGALEALLRAEPNLLEAAQTTALAAERLALETLARLQSEGRLAPELEACLWLHGGELGRFPGTWLDLAREANTIADLERAIAQENLNFLEDPTPAARVRAFDFLDKRGLAPLNFDPLGNRTERRKALAAALEETSRGAAAATVEPSAPAAQTPPGGNR